VIAKDLAFSEGDSQNDTRWENYNLVRDGFRPLTLILKYDILLTFIQGNIQLIAILMKGGGDV